MSNDYYLGYFDLLSKLHFYDINYYLKPWTRGNVHFPLRKKTSKNAVQCSDKLM